MTEGLLLVDKPEGPTSHDIVGSVRRALGGLRCGHAGTLDPFATGLLVVAVGRATRLLRFLERADKTYSGLIRLGWRTTTDDRTGIRLGEVLAVEATDEAIARAAAALEGDLMQLPPAFSARKHEGVRHYRLARRGRAVPLKESPVTIRWLACERLARDLVRCHVRVSAGTYIRALARDFGALLGCGGHLEALRRTGSGPFRVEDALAVPAGRGEAPAADRLARATIPIDEIPLGLPARKLTEEEARAVEAGRPIPFEAGVSWPFDGGVSGPFEAPALDAQAAREDPAPLPDLPLSKADPTPARQEGRAWCRLLDGSGRLLAVAEAIPPARNGDPPRLQPRVVLGSP
jgi:tRNA pseudouridine55 synthase